MQNYRTLKTVKSKHESLCQPKDSTVLCLRKAEMLFFLMQYHSSMSPSPVTMRCHIKLLTEHILNAKEDAVKYAGKRGGMKEKESMNERASSSSSHSTT